MSKPLIFFWLSQSFVDLDVCLRSLSCWKVKFLFIFIFPADAQRFWSNSDIAKNWMSPQNWWKDKMKTSQVGCQEFYRSTATLKGLQDFPESATRSAGCILLRRTNSHILHMFGVWGRVARRTKEKKQKTIKHSYNLQKQTSPPKNQVSRKHVGNLCQKIRFGVATPKEHHTYGKAWRWQYHPVISSILYYKTLKNYKEIPISSGTSQT